jgi:hypothetical protein
MYSLLLSDGPENSIEALRLASQNGARMVEFDLRYVKTYLYVWKKCSREGGGSEVDGQNEIYH